MNNKIYIAGRVSGIKYETAKKNFSRAERYWSRKGYEVINPTKLCNKEWCWWRCMAVCLWNLFKCKHAYFIPNYVYSKGARIELFFAKLLRKKIYFLNSDFERNNESKNLSIFNTTTAIRMRWFGGKKGVGFYNRIYVYNTSIFGIRSNTIHIV